MTSRSGIGETAIVSTLAALKALATEWEVLAQSIGVPMLSHAWILSCAESLHAGDELYIIVARIGGVLAGIAPLVIKARAGIKRLELIGSARLYEPSGLLYDNERTLDVLLRAIASTRWPVVLSRLPTQSPIGPRLQSVARGVMWLNAGADALAVPITSSWDDYLAGLSSRRRHDLKRARRRAEEMGAVVVRVCSPRPEDIPQMFADFVAVESAGWKARNGTSLAQRDDLRQFFSSYATRAAHAGIVRFGFLDIDGRPVAAQLSVEYAGRLWVLKIGYDEAWSRCSPGWQLLAEMMRYAFERRLKSYEFLGSDETWLHRWDTESRQLSTLIWYPRTPLGLYGFATDVVARTQGKVASWSKGYRGQTRV